MESYGAECVYVTDSAGALLPAQYAERVKAVRAGAEAGDGRSASTPTTT